jgi:hypothetical protein
MQLDNSPQDAVALPLGAESQKVFRRHNSVDMTRHSLSHGTIDGRQL